MRSGARRQRGLPTGAEVVLETSTYDLTVFKVHFGNLSLKAYTKGECVLRFEVTVHNTRELGCGRVVARFPEIVRRLSSMLERFLTQPQAVALESIATFGKHVIPRFDQDPVHSTTRMREAAARR